MMQASIAEWFMQTGSSIHELHLRDIAYVTEELGRDERKIIIIKDRYGGDWIIDWCRNYLGKEGTVWDVFTSHPPVLMIRGQEAWMFWTMSFG